MYYRQAFTFLLVAELKLGNVVSYLLYPCINGFTCMQYLRGYLLIIVFLSLDICVFASVIKQPRVVSSLY